MEKQAPERSLAQRRAALEEANRIRSYRARVKRDVKAGRRGFESLLCDEDCATMKLIEAILALPKVGRVRANRVLRRTRVSPSKTLGGLTGRQREELLVEFAGSPPALRVAGA